MRTDLGDAEKWRVNYLDKLTGQHLSRPGDPFGVFLVKKPDGWLLVVVSPGDDEIPWEHVSVSARERCPTWAEMTYVKSLFWRPDECVMQLHVPESEHINCHPHCLHLWKPTKAEIPRPPKIAVGP